MQSVGRSKLIVVDDGTSTKSVLARSRVLDHSGFLANFVVNLFKYFSTMIGTEKLRKENQALRKEIQDLNNQLKKITDDMLNFP